MDQQEFAKVGAELVELGTKLKELKAQRAVLDKEIAELESKVRTLMAKHTQMLAEIVGVPTSVSEDAPMGMMMAAEAVGSKPEQAMVPTGSVVSTGITPRQEKARIKARVLAFLENAEPGTSALQIADALRIDAAAVREVMAELAVRGHQPSGG